MKVLEPDLWHQLLLIHKGHAGLIFLVFGIALGASLLFSLISGVVLAITVKLFRVPALVVTFVGLGVLVVLVAVGG